MTAYILRNREFTDETKKARKAKHRGQWIRGALGTARDGELKWIRPKFIAGPAGSEGDAPDRA
jgi:hypothetical protein